MGQALYRKYRSQTLDEVVGQDHIIAVLDNSLKSGNLSHAYLFTGPRGVGKTSVARILAKAANNLSPNDNNFYSDIIEIDAASNRRIEEVRELRDKIAIAPSQLKYKVYIVDEVHMLTREAFNALLKTLEEPPAHAIFILATTDFHKVPDTIASRCMRLNFKLIAQPDLINSLKAIADKEKIDIDSQALELIASQSGGSFRDALSLLDQLSSTKQKIDVKLIELTLGLANQQSIFQLIEAIASSDTSGILAQIQNMIDGGITPDQLNKQLSSQLRQSLADQKNSKLASSQLVELIGNLNAVYSYQDQRIALELAILKTITPKYLPPIDEPKTVQPVQETQKTQSLPAKTNIGDDKLWQSVLEKLKDQNNTLYSIARMAEPTLSGSQLTLAFKFPFHIKQMELPKNKNLIRSILDNTENDIELFLIASTEEKASNSKARKPPSDKKPASDLSSISNIFGSAEVLES